MFWAAKCVQLLRSKVFRGVKCSLVQSVPQPALSSLLFLDENSKLLRYNLEQYWSDFVNIVRNLSVDVACSDLFTILDI